MNSRRRPDGGLAGQAGNARTPAESSAKPWSCRRWRHPRRASIAIGVDHEHHRPAARHRLPTSRPGGAHAPRDRGIIELKTTARQPLHQSLGRRKLQQCFALGILLENGNRHSLPTFVIRQMRFALQVPIIRHAIDIYGAGIASGVRHIAGTSMAALTKHGAGSCPRRKPCPRLPTGPTTACQAAPYRGTLLSPIDEGSGR